MTEIMNLVLQDGNLQRERGKVYGIYKGFYITMVLGEKSSDIDITVNYCCNGYEIKSQADQYFSQLRLYKEMITKTSVQEYCLEISLRMTTPEENNTAVIDGIVNDIINFLISEGCNSGCKLCGKDNVSYYEINDTPNYMCQDCNNNSNIDLNSITQSKFANRSHLIPGIIGALIGAMIGGVLWVLIYQLGYIAGIAGAVTIVCSMFGYRKLGGSLDIKGIIISCIVSIIIIFLANQIAWTWEIMREFNEMDGTDSYSFFMIYRNFFDILDYYSITSSFVKDLIIGYFLLIIAGFSTVSKAIKTAKITAAK